MSRIIALANRHKMVAGVLPTIILLGLTNGFPTTSVQLFGLLATFPAVLLFIIAYVPERPDRYWFGSSLLIRSFGVLAVVLAAALVRLFGPSAFQQQLVTVFIGMTFSSMTIGAIYLIQDQARHHRAFGGWLRKRFTKGTS